MRYNEEQRAALNRRPLLRPGIDHDPVAPYVWGSYAMVEPVEVMSFACPSKSDGVIDDTATLMIRTTPGDPTTLREVPLAAVACFDRSRHQDNLKYPEPGT